MFLQHVFTVEGKIHKDKKKEKREVLIADLTLSPGQSGSLKSIFTLLISLPNDMFIDISN